MSRSRTSHDVPGRTARSWHASTAVAALCALAALGAYGCARVTSPQETVVPGTPAPAAEATPVDTVPAEPLPVEEAPPPVEEAPAPPLEARALTDVRWRLTDLHGEPVVAGALAEREPHLRLSADGTTASGATGCNAFSGPYTLAGDALGFGTLVTTKVACVDPAMAEQEQRFIDALHAADRFELNGDVLTLFAETEAVARFEATM